MSTYCEGMIEIVMELGVIVVFSTSGLEGTDVTGSIPSGNKWGNLKYL
jgi:hypothetical protein